MCDMAAHGTRTGEQQLCNHLDLTVPLRARNAGWRKKKRSQDDGWREASCGMLIGIWDAPAIALTRVWVFKAVSPITAPTGGMRLPFVLVTSCVAGVAG